MGRRKDSINYPSRARKRTRRSMVMKKIHSEKKYSRSEKYERVVLHDSFNKSSTIPSSEDHKSPSESYVQMGKENIPCSSVSKTNECEKLFLQQGDYTLTSPITNKDPTERKEETTSEYLYYGVSREEYNSIMAHELYYEQEKLPMNNNITGNRVVNLNYVLNWAFTMQRQHFARCPGVLEITEEIRRGTGLVSCIVFKCNICSREYKQYTEDPDKISTINYGAVWGTLASGSTFGHLEELMSVMDIPPMTFYTFKKIEGELAERWKDELYSNMEIAGKTERSKAIELGNIDADGVPYITVYLDGGWSKRSYGHSYNAASGTAVIIGKESGQLLFLGVRNKYCSICARAANKQQPASQHICFRNWSASSAAMEADIIVEGFCKSEEMHSIRYKYFIADGDSSVYCKIREKVPYGNMVNKIECTNHAIKNYGKALRKIKSDTNNVHIEARKLLTIKAIEELEKRAQNSIYENAKADVECLKEDLINSPFHVFQDHSRCKTYYCDSVNEINQEEIHRVKSSGLLLHIEGALEGLLRKAHKLIDNETNNRAEIFMAILARFNAGKRLNLTQRGSFETRSHLAGLRYNKGVEWHYDPWKDILSQSPGSHFKKYIEIQKQKGVYKVCRNLSDFNAKRNITTNKHTTVTMRKRLLPIPNVDYGPKAMQAPLSDEEFKSECNRILKKLQITAEDQQQISKLTIGQFENDTYLQHRKYRLTASFFGQVVNRKDYTSCHALVKSILYPKSNNAKPLEFGKQYEPMVRKRFCQENGISIEETGLFIDTKRGYLAASPDGIIGNNELLEIKCLYSAAKAGVSLVEAIKTIKTNFCLQINSTGELSLKRNHKYYYQIQGQLNITGRENCKFVIYSGDRNPLYVEDIPRDQTLWENVMVPQLERFYLECVLPEIVRRHIPKGINCIDPPYILEAKRKKENTQEKKK